MTELWAIGLVILATVVGSYGSVLLKKASNKISFKISSFISNYNLMGGFLFYGMGTILFIPTLKGGELSVLYPFVALSYIWVSLFSLKFLDEKMNKWKWIGIVCILIGVSLIGMGKG